MDDFNPPTDINPGDSLHVGRFSRSEDNRVLHLQVRLENDSHSFWTQVSRYCQELAEGVSTTPSIPPRSDPPRRPPPPPGGPPAQANSVGAGQAQSTQGSHRPGSSGDAGPQPTSWMAGGCTPSNLTDLQPCEAQVQSRLGTDNNEEVWWAGALYRRVLYARASARWPTTGADEDGPDSEEVISIEDPEEPERSRPSSSSTVCV